MDAATVLSNLCIVLTIAVFSTGIPQCLQMFKQRSTENVPFLPYLMTNFNNLAWILYSTLTNNWTVYIVNFIGAILQTIYMVVYFIYSPTKLTEIKQTAIAGLLMCLCWFYVSSYQQDVNVSKDFMGIVCSIVTILMFSSPLAELRTVVQKQSTDSLSFPLTVTTFFCTTLWTMYGLAIGDKYIVIPNSPGIFTSLIRFYFFGKYRKKTVGSFDVL